MTLRDYRERLLESFTAALHAAEPGALVERHLPETAPDLILAVGKGALGMLAPARARFPGTRWLASPPHPVGNGSASAAASGATVTAVPSASSALIASAGAVLSGSHPLPDPGSVAAAEAALDAVRVLEPTELVLVLVSGGGSALWSAPRGIDLATKRDLTSHLLLAGADILQLNVVRKHLSGIKGGRLAGATRARLLTLALSDVPGDDIATIASGPTVPDASTFDQAIAVLEEFGLLAARAREHLLAGSRGEAAETPKPGGEIEGRSSARVIGSNETLLSAAAHYWRGEGFPVLVLSSALQGDVRELAKAHADLAAALAHGDDPSAALAALAPAGRAADVIHRATALARAAGGRPVAVVSGGEATVSVTGAGKGGRNQEFALWLHHYLRRSDSDAYVAALAAGSDGVDGNSTAAGAIISPTTGARAAERGLSPAAYLLDNDSHSFFARLDDTVHTGPTGTNLNDYRVMLVVGAA